MKRLAALALCAGMAVPALAVDRFGIAQSRESFSLQRDGREVIQRANSFAELRAGDSLAATQASLQISGTNGSAFHLARNGQASIAADGAPVLHSGIIASSSTAEAPATLRYESLTLKPSGAERLVFAASVDEEGLLTAQAVEGDLSILAGEEQVAFLAQGDTVTLASDGDIWQQASPGTGAPVSIFRMQGPDDPDGGQDGRRPFFFVPGGAVGAGVVGGVALGVGGYYVYNEYIDDDDDDDDSQQQDDDPFDRGTVSPTGPDFPIGF